MKCPGRHRSVTQKQPSPPLLSKIAVFILSKCLGYFDDTLSTSGCTISPFMWSSCVQMMPRCPSILRGCSTQPNGREERRERKWQTQTRGILGATKNSTEKRGGRGRRGVCRHNDEGNRGWVIFSCFKNELFCSQNRGGGRERKKKKSFYSWVHVPFTQIKQGLFWELLSSANVG